MHRAADVRRRDANHIWGDLGGRDVSRALLFVPVVVAAGCNTSISGPTALDFVGSDIAMTPGLASCVTAIGRADLTIDPEADMTNDEIEALLTCTAERASG